MYTTEELTTKLSNYFLQLSNLNLEEYNERFLKLDDVLSGLVHEHTLLTNDNRTLIGSQLMSIFPKCSTLTKIHLLSFLMQFCNNSTYTNQLLTLTLDTNELDENNKFFLYYQIVSKLFTSTTLSDSTTNDLRDQLYRQIYLNYKANLQEKLSFIPIAERNSNLIIVFISQFLSLNHGPTKTILDRCSVIKNTMHKTPFIINTAEFLPYAGFVPFYGTDGTSYYEELLSQQSVAYQNDSFSYFQCDRTMPNLEDISSIVDSVKQLKPYCIFNIGGDSILNDICSNIVPTITVTTIPSARAITEGQFQVIGRELTEEDRIWAAANGKSTNHMIQCRFTSSFKPQTTTLTRKDLGLPEDAFIGLVVGGRLTKEVTDSFIAMLCNVMDHNIFIVFMGSMDTYDSICNRNPIFKLHSRYLGLMPDALAVNECCNLYINPKRIGGGTSVAEALYKGLPAVTMNFGDVGLGAGEDFYVSDYDDMADTIIKYANDPAFYAKMSKKATKRASILTDSASEFVKILATAERCEEFK